MQRRSRGSPGPLSSEPMGTAAISVLRVSDEQLWRAFDAKARRDEDAYRAAVLALFLRERESVVERLESSSPFPADAPFPLIDPYVSAALLFLAADYAFGGQYRMAWIARFRPLLRKTLGAGGRSVIGLRFNLENPRALQAIQQRALKLSGNVTETTLQRVRDVLTQARKDGVGMSQIAKRIREDAFGGSISRARATTIARTETVGALNEGSHLAAMQSGMRSKRWLDQKDGRVRDSHRAAAADGWIPFANVFSNGLLYPHEPSAPAEEVINCRCSLLYSDLSAAEANRP